MTMSAKVEVGSLEEQALKRRERLKNLKRKVDEKPEESGNDENKQSEIIEIPKPNFRSYKPEEELKVTEDTKLPSIEDEIKDHLDEMKIPLEVKDIDITNLAPKKVDFDLKRSIAKKLQKLEKRTQKAISELIHERLNTGQSTLLEQVNIGAQETQQQQQDDEDSD